MNRRRFLCASAAAGGAAGAGCGRAGPLEVLTACDVHRDTYPTVVAVKWMAQELRTRTGGRVSMRAYPSAQLGAEDDTVMLAQSGVIDICRVNSASLNNAFPLTQPLSMPFVIESDAHLHHVVDGPVGAEILAGFARRGLVGLAIYDAGGRCFYNTARPIEKPADLAGLKIRVPQSDVFIEAVAAMGANPTPLTVSAVYSSLQSRLVDGAENNWPTFETSRHVEVARHWSETRHSYSPEFLLMSQRSWDRMERRDRDLVADLARASVAVMRAAWRETEAEARARALAAGTIVTPARTDLFRDACGPVLAHRLRDAEVAAIHAKIRALA